MKRAFFAIFFFLSAIFGAEFDMKQSHTLLLNVNENIGEITDDPDIIIGSSGVVMHKFSDDSKSIIARAVVTEKSGGFAKVRFEVFRPYFSFKRFL